MRALRDIVEVATELGLDLTESGDEHAAVCPVHDDTDPSLFIHPGKGVWYCFGCGVGGNAYTLAVHLGHNPEIAYDPDADSFGVPSTVAVAVEPVDLDVRFLAASRLIAAGLVRGPLTMEIDQAAAIQDDERLAALLSVAESELCARLAERG